MKRVAVLGPPGAGKSTFSLKFSQKTGLPIYHIDQFYLEKPDYWDKHQDEWYKFCLDIINKDKWIIDGNYSATFDERFKRSDLIIYLDVSRLASYKGVLRRRIEYIKNKRPGMPADWEEKLNLKFMKFIWKFHSANNRDLKETLKNYDYKNIKVFRSRNDANQYIDSIK